MTTTALIRPTPHYSKGIFNFDQDVWGPPPVKNGSPSKQKTKNPGDVPLKSEVVSIDDLLQKLNLAKIAADSGSSESVTAYCSQLKEEVPESLKSLIQVLNAAVNELCGNSQTALNDCYNAYVLEKARCQGSPDIVPRIEPLLYWVQCYMRQGFYLGAERIIHDCLNQFITSGKLWGVWFQYMHMKAVEKKQKAVKEDPFEDILNYRRRFPYTAETACEAVRMLMNPFRVNGSNKDHEKVKTLLEQALEDFPRYGDLYLEMIRFKFLQEGNKPDFTDLKKRVENTNDVDGPEWSLCKTYDSMTSSQMFSIAVSLIKKRMRVNPDPSDPHLSMSALGINTFTFRSRLFERKTISQECAVRYLVNPIFKTIQQELGFMKDQALSLKNSLKEHDIFWALTPFQYSLSKAFVEFINRYPGCFERTNSIGHLTGSAFVVNRTFDRVLLTFHAKLKKWLQLGGHADGHPLLHEVALREAQEESGLKRFSFFPMKASFPHPIPFDLDIHQIPETLKEKEHLHYDVRYLLIAEEGQSLAMSDESLDLQWVNINEIPKYTTEESILRQVSKLKLLSQQSTYQNRI